jgi:formate C-acetyltransferase
MTNQYSIPWWEKSSVLWDGNFFQNMILPPHCPAERRIQDIRAAMLPHYQDGKRRLSIQKALIVTHSYQNSEGLHPALRRAQAMLDTFRNIPLGLLDGQLIMGSSSSGPHEVDFNPFFLPFDAASWDQGELKNPFEGAEKVFLIQPDDLMAINELILPYWKTHAREIAMFHELKQYNPEAWHHMLYGQTYRASTLVGGGLCHTIQDYISILKRGLLAIMQDIRNSISHLDAENPAGTSTFDRRNQYEAMLLAAQGMIDYAGRNAAYAESLAKTENNVDRQKELLQMAAICRKVPAYPAETWWEALQSFHFLRAGTAMVESGDAHSAGRFDQYMLPFLENDLACGRISQIQAQELLECLFLKWNESRAFKLTQGSMGGSNNDKVNIGGMDVAGNDCTNPLTYMMLEAHAHVHLTDPNISIRMHKNSPADLISAALEVIRLGGGLPVFINDEVIIPALVSTCGVNLQDARHYGDVGCQENITDPNMTGADTNGRTNIGWGNLPKPIELALYNGTNPINRQQVAPATGDPRSFTTMEQFLEAVRIQVNHAVKMQVIINNVYDYVFTRDFPCVFHNLMHPGPRKNGIDINAGGCQYNWEGMLAVGLANAGDMLSAIDTVIFQQKSATWDQLLGALENNWQDYSILHKECLVAPKYGCDNFIGDQWAKTYLNMYIEAFESHSTPHGGHYVMGLVSMGNYVTLGKWLGATPDGRMKGERLADSVSPSHLAPVVGPTATHRSVARTIDSFHTPNGVTFNQRFNARSLENIRDIQKWADLVRSYMEDGGQEVQYTVVNGEELKHAQINPDAYRDLIVRVGGYSAIFVELSKEVQDSIIERTEQTI